MPDRYLNLGILKHYHFFRNTDAGFSWLGRSMAVNGGNGSSGYYHILKGWSKPYPETTGYLISTYIDFYKCFPDSKYFKPALDLGKWLIELYDEHKYFPGGLNPENRPFVFDSAQILHGLTSLYHITLDPYYSDAIKNTYEWLIDIISDREKWLKCACAEGFIPAYYLRVIWILSDTAGILSYTSPHKTFREVIDHFVDDSTAHGWIKNYGTEPASPVSTHFIAYALQGILEYGDLTSNSRYVNCVRSACNEIKQSVRNQGRLAGQFYPDWNPHNEFTCLVGNAQFSLLFARLFEITGETEYFKIGVFLLNHVIRDQSWLLSRGGIPGSSPIWGPYQRFKFPNWAVKFYLDAYLKWYQLVGKTDAVLNEL